MNIDIFAQQVQSLQERLTKLYENMIPSEIQISSFFPIALKELGTTSEELQVAAEELLRQTDVAANLQQQLQETSQRYEDLLEFMPDAYLVTDTLGKILEANSAAARLLNLEKNKLLGKSLINFIPLEQRSVFHLKLAQIQQGSRIHNCTESLRLCEDTTVDVAITVAPIHNSSSEVTALR